MLRSFRKWLSIKKEQNAQFIILIGIIAFNILLWLFASLAAFVLDPINYPTIFDALGRSIMWLLDPGTYNPEVPTSLKIISVIIIITAMVTFSGGIIAYVANVFSLIIDSSRKGRGRLHIYNHILILNWNDKALELIIDYRYNSSNTDIVVLSNESKQNVLDQIRNKLYETKDLDKTKKVNVIVREGNVFSESNLDDVCIQKAKAIIILADEDNYEDETAKADILSIKALMMVVTKIVSEKQTIIIEVKNKKSVELIENKIEIENVPNQIVPILPDEIMGKLIAQTILIPYINDVYKELLSYQGSEFYATEDHDIEEYIKTHNRSVPVISKGMIYCLAEHKKDLESIRAIPLSEARAINICLSTKYIPKTIVIFGKNRKYHYILESIRLYESDCNTKVNIISIPTNDAEFINNSITKLTKIDAILILSEDRPSTTSYDADVLITLLMIHDIAKKHKADIIIELLNPRHYDIAQKYNINNVIVSNIYISHLMSQISRNRNLFPLFNDLFNYDAIDTEDPTYEIYTYKAHEIFNEVFPITFNSIAEYIYAVFIATKNNYTMIGIIRNNVIEIFKGNLDTKEKFIINKNDHLIILHK